MTTPRRRRSRSRWQNNSINSNQSPTCKKLVFHELEFLVVPRVEVSYWRGEGRSDEEGRMVVEL